MESGFSPTDSALAVGAEPRISDALPFGGLWYGEPDAIGSAIDYAKFRSRAHDAVQSRL
jgi:hypothetical protein